MFSDVGGDFICVSFGSSWSLNAFSKIIVGLASVDGLMRPNVGDGPSLPLGSDELVFRKFRNFLRSPGIMSLCAQMSMKL